MFGLIGKTYNQHHKPFDEYRIGEEIKAKLPNYGARLWNGVIVEIGGIYLLLFPSNLNRLFFQENK